RAPDQLDSRLDTNPLGYWRAEAARKRPGAPSRVLRLRVFLPHPDAAEVAAVCRIDGRVRALAARFERRGQAWCCTVLRLA
ncbi:MAG TPA: Rv3235 family protein, partial [Pseudonocardia sp.]